MKIIELNRSVTESNDKDAEALREKMRAAGVLMFNLMSSPGSGKTTLLSRVITDMKSELKIGVMEADIASDVDAAKIEKLGARVIQAHTGGMCHMDAGMTERAINAMGNENLNIVFLENVGNLICPAEFDTGAERNIMILSVPEGDDKPLKYPLMFQKSDALVITKIDTKDYFNFDFSVCEKRVRSLNSNIEIFHVSAKTGDGMSEFENWIRQEYKKYRLRF